MRQIVLDTETTGLEPSQGHRVIEIGCVELVNRKLTGQHYHQYINPRREIDQGAIEVHGITNEFLADKPVFERIAGDFLEFVAGAELIIHNAPFDLGFLNSELQRIEQGHTPLEATSPVVDTLLLARSRHPGQRNSLDALCVRYGVDNSQRELHGALLDAEILADVYLALTGGQTSLQLSDAVDADGTRSSRPVRRLPEGRKPLPVIAANAAEIAAHEAMLTVIADACEDAPVWARAETGSVGGH